MSNSNVIITPPLNVETDLGGVLGTGSGDVGTNCASTSVNPWAMFKPVAVSGFGPVTRDSGVECLGLGNASRVAGPPYATTITAFLALCADSATMQGKPANGWRWLAPRGLATYNEPYRVYDFLRYTAGGGLSNRNGYNHNASNPFGSFNCTDRVVRTGGRFNATNSQPLPETNVPDTDITIGNINAFLGTAIKMAYYGVLLVPSDTSLAYKLIGNSETRIYDDMVYSGHENMALEEFYLSQSSFPDGTTTWTAYPFLTNVAFPDGNLIGIAHNSGGSTLADSRRLYPLPGSVARTVTVYQDNLTINVYATTATHAYKTKIYFEITNNYGTSVTITDLMLKVRAGNKGYTDARISGEVFYDKNYVYNDSYPSGTTYNNSALSAMLSSVTVAAGATVTVPVSGTVDFYLPSFDNTKIYIGTNYGGNAHYGYTTVRVPAGANLE